MKTTVHIIQRPALAVVAVLSLISLAVHGSEPIDSGWAVSRPMTDLNATPPANLQLRVAINHVLEQSRNPILQTPAQDASDTTPDDEPQIVFGSYGASADGWRPVLANDSPQAAPTEQTATTASERPRFRSATPKSTEPATISETKAEPEKAGSPSTTENKSEAKAEKTTTDADEPADSSNNAGQQPPVAKEPPAEPLPPLSQNMKNLRAKVRRVIKSYYSRPLNSRDNDPWELMHGMLAYGVLSKIRQGGPQGSTITLVGWLCYNRPSKGMTLLYLTPENDLRGKQGVGLQGHMGQFLAMLAQCRVSPDYPIRVRDKEFTINDLIAAEEKTCYPKSELTFKLIALMHYLDSDATWVNDQGSTWDIPRLIREELAQPIRGAACGGTHRLAGLSLAARTRVRRGEPLDGEYVRAAQFVEKYQNYAFQLQNRDGSLSTNWFRGRGDEDDIDRRVKTTGHILEWLCYSLDDQEIHSVRTFRATNYLASLLASNFNHDWEVGPLGHAIHALRLYDERVFQPYDNQDEVAKKPAHNTSQRSSSRTRYNSAQF